MGPDYAKSMPKIAESSADRAQRGCAPERNCSVVNTRGESAESANRGTRGHKSFDCTENLNLVMLGYFCYLPIRQVCHLFRQWSLLCGKGLQRLTEIPGVGPVTATALVAAVGNASTFGKGRNLAAWMGIVPGEYSTGGKQKLLGISKRGNKYLRTLFIQGARSVVQQRHKQAPGLSSWLAQLLARAHKNVVIVALANKLVRMAWAVLCKKESYRAPILAVAI